MEATAATRADFAAQLADLGFLPPSYARACAEGARALPPDAAAFDDASGNARIVKAALCAGFYPSILRVEHPAAVFAETHGGALEKDADPARLKFFDRRRGVLPPAACACDKMKSCTTPKISQQELDQLQIHRRRMVQGLGLLVRARCHTCMQAGSEYHWGQS